MKAAELITALMEWTIFELLSVRKFFLNWNRSMTLSTKKKTFLLSLEAAGMGYPYIFSTPCCMCVQHLWLNSMKVRAQMTLLNEALRPCPLSPR